MCTLPSGVRRPEESQQHISKSLTGGPPEWLGRLVEDDQTMTKHLPPELRSKYL